MRTPDEWADLCEEYIDAGPLGAKADKRSVYAQGQHIVSLLRAHNLWQPGDFVIDIGSGNGRLAMGLVEKPVIYHGIEIIGQCVDFCRFAFKDYPAFHFHHLDVRNGRYNPDGMIDPATVRYPFGDGVADVVLAHSVFTHINSAAVIDHMLAEFQRLIKPGGLLYCTWFRSPPNELDTDEDRVVWGEMVIREFLSEFEWVADWGGQTTGPNDGWQVVIKNGR